MGLNERQAFEERKAFFDLGVSHRMSGVKPDYSSIPLSPGGKPLKEYVQAYEAGYGLRPTMW